MAIEIDRVALQALTKTLADINRAFDQLRMLDTIEKGPENRLYWISVQDRQSEDSISERLVQSMRSAAKRRAAEMGAILRAEALEKATAEIDTLRAVLCSQAAAATIELARIVRDARERG